MGYYTLNKALHEINIILIFIITTVRNLLSENHTPHKICITNITRN